MFSSEALHKSPTYHSSMSSPPGLSKSESLSFPNVQVTSSIVFDAPVDDVALPVEP